MSWFAYFLVRTNNSQSPFDSLCSMCSVLRLSVATWRRLLHWKAWRNCKFAWDHSFDGTVPFVYCSHFPAIFILLHRWFMPVNILLTFVIGSMLAWIVNIIARTPQHLRGLVMGCCAAGTRLSKILLESQFGLFSHARQSRIYHQTNLFRNRVNYVCLRSLSLTLIKWMSKLKPRE